MVIAMSIVRVMQMAIYKIIDMVSMRHRLVSTAWTMYMTLLMSRTYMPTGALIWVAFGHFQHMLLHRSCICRMVQMAIVQIVDMITVLQSRMPTVLAMPVRVIVMSVAHW
jgi:hypothetical protein